MKIIRFGKTELQVSELAFGGIPIQRLTHAEAVKVVRGILDLGINFIDTAHGYTTSEERIGEAISSRPRESIVLASKSPAVDRDGFMRQLELSLKNLGTDYIDIYQHHNVGSDEKMQAILASGGAWEGMREALDAGLIRHPAFSAHSLEIAVKMMRTGQYEAVQIPFNFVDAEAADKILPLAAELDMGVIAMKPLGGGLLDNARLCFRYLRQFPGIVPDPGIERLEQMSEIIAFFKEGSPLTTEENEAISRIKHELGTSWCHRCDYCQPCPEGIPISRVLTSTSFMRRMPMNRVRSFIGSAMDKALACTRCGSCESRCPYNLAIPDLLKQRREEYTAFLTTSDA